MLEKIIEELIVKLPEKRRYFRVGASLEEVKSIEERLSVFGLGFTQELKELYLWINGSGYDFDERVPLFIFDFYSLSDAYGLFQENYQKNKTTYWPLGIFEDTNSNIIATLSNVHSDRSLILQDFYEEIVLFHQSVECMLKVALNCWENDLNFTNSITLDDLRLRYSPRAYPALGYEQFPI